MSSWAVALRVARRDARRARGRSALVLAMIALPVLGVTAVDVVAQTYALSPAQKATRDLGAADAAVSDTGLTQITQVGGSGFGSDGVGRRPLDPASVLPQGSRTLVDRTADATVSFGPATSHAGLRELAYADPLAAGLYRQVAGRPPARPDEVDLTTGLAARLGASVGDRLQLPGGPADVVGTVADASRHDATTVLLAPGRLTEAATSRLLVGLPTPLTWDLVRTANAAGVLVTTRGARLPGQPAEPTGSAVGATTLTSIGLVVGMALLEVVLLAGPAFAVGAKRSERVLALLAVSGADRRAVRRTVLAGGVVLGAVAGVGGALGGIALARLALPVLGPHRPELPGPFDVHVLEVAGIAAVGSVTAVLAALLPALNAARQDVLAGLTGRRGVRQSGPLVPLVGVLAAAAGTLLALHGARARSVNTILAGAALAELGLVATTPAVVGLAGRLGPLLPAAPRLALRDAARNRSRTAPAVAAVLAAVAGSVAVGTYVSSLDRDDRSAYTPSAAVGTVWVELGATGAGPAAGVPALSAALTRVLPGRRAVVVSSIDQDGSGSGRGAYTEVLVPLERQCPDGAGNRQRQSDPRCRSLTSSSAFGPLAIGGPDVGRALDGAHDAAVLAVLDRGGVLVPARSLRADGTALLVVHPPGDDDGTRGIPFTLPAAALPAGGLQTPVLSPQGAAAMRLTTRPAGLLAAGRPPSAGEEDRARAAVLAVAPSAQLEVERGYASRYGVGLLALLLGSAALVLGASGTATGLAAADGRADLSTLAAVGASPGLRRRLAASQSIVTAGLGTVLGTAAGLVPAVGLIRAINAVDSTGYQRPVPFPLVIPWSSIAVTLLVVPLLAGLLALLLTRSQLPLVRRIA